MKCELQPSLLPVQLLIRLPLHGQEQMQVQVLVQVPKPPLLPEMVLLVELVPVVTPSMRLYLPRVEARLRGITALKAMSQVR